MLGISVHDWGTLRRWVPMDHLNVDLRGIGHPDRRISSPGRALAAYAEVAAMKRFSGGGQTAVG